MFNTMLESSNSNQRSRFKEIKSRLNVCAGSPGFHPTPFERLKGGERKRWFVSKSRRTGERIGNVGLYWSLMVGLFCGGVYRTDKLPTCAGTVQAPKNPEAQAVAVCEAVQNAVVRVCAKRGSRQDGEQRPQHKPWNKTARELAEILRGRTQPATIFIHQTAHGMHSRTSLHWTHARSRLHVPCPQTHSARMERIRELCHHRVVRIPSEPLLPA